MEPWISSITGLDWQQYSPSKGSLSKTHLSGLAREKSIFRGADRCAPALRTTRSCFGLRASRLTVMSPSFDAALEQHWFPMAAVSLTTAP